MSNMHNAVVDNASRNLLSSCATLPLSEEPFWLTWQVFLELEEQSFSDQAVETKQKCKINTDSLRIT